MINKIKCLIYYIFEIYFKIPFNRLNYNFHISANMLKSQVSKNEGDMLPACPLGLEIHTLAWPDADEDFVREHRATCEFLGFEVKYHRQRIQHGLWMDSVLLKSKRDVVGFLDLDCVPTNSRIVYEAHAWVKKNKTFFGISQVSNHIPPKSHIFAAPAFFFIDRQTWLRLGKPSFAETMRSDVAENVSYVAEMAGLRYKSIFPTHWTAEPAGGPWRLHTYGLYGIGTHYEGGVFHLYEGRMSYNKQIFIQACQSIRSGQFSNVGRIESRRDYEARLAC